MMTYLYNLIIEPLVLIIEFIYTIMSRMIGNIGLSIIAVSVVVSILILPLYRRADAIQEAERDKQADMEHWVNHIKKTFKGDEQYMMLTTYYRQMDYHPLYSLRSSISLLLQIPFFIAAYRFLSGLSALRGVPFGPIADLSAPDGMITLGGMTINVLPILMTVINLLSGAVYSKGQPFKMKVQQYILTLLFLVLLYQRPAGLVMYWTMNNVFSLAKNLITKVSKHPQRDTALCSSLLGLAFLVLASGNVTNRKRVVLVAAIFLVSQMPLLAMLFRRGYEKIAGSLREGVQKLPRSVFILGGVFLTLLAGYLIPISVISDSPAEFFNPEAYVSPLRFAFSTLSIAAGFFLVWSNIFYSLASKKYQKVFALAFWVCGICGLVNYMFFSRNFGVLSTQLTFENTVAYGKKQMLLNLLVILVLTAVLLWVWKKHRAFVSRIYAVGILGLAVLCISDTVKTQSYIGSLTGLVPAREAAKNQTDDELEPIFRFSRTGKNVVVLMMDRMIGAYMPYMLKEKPELKEQFSGFTWYANTLSYGRSTNYGSPALYGGYEYTPTAMNERDSLSLAEKQNEAVRLMPVLFLDEGYEVTVCDPSLAGYKWIPDLSIYDDYPEIDTYNTMYMPWSAELEREFTPQYEKLQYRNFFFYSIFRMVPNVFQPAVYDEDHYFSASSNTVVEQKFLNSYGALTHLPAMSEITDEDTNTFLMMANKTSHEATLLQLPDYVPSLYVDNSLYYDEDNYTVDGATLIMTKAKHFSHYCANMASMLVIGRWLDYLKENGVYDNTRIIIVADHGHTQGQLDSLRTEWFDIMALNPMLMVKDFGAEGEIEANYDFMTNGDTPVLAMDGLIEDPVNPFTGNPVTSDGKKGQQLVTTSHHWSVGSNHGNTYDTGDGRWLGVEDNILDKKNWVLVKETEYVEEE